MSDDRFEPENNPSSLPRAPGPTADEIEEFLEWYRRMFGVEPDETDQVGRARAHTH